MSHATMKEKVFALYDGELGPEEKTLAQAHLDACPECRAELAAWKTASARFFRPAPVHTSESFVRAVMDRLDEEEPSRESAWARLRALLTPPRLVLAGAAALAASVVLWPSRPAVPADPDAAVLHVVEVLDVTASDDAALDASVEEYFLS